VSEYWVVDFGNAWLSIPGTILWLIFATFFFAVADKAQTKTGSILSFTIMFGAFTIFLINMGWFFLVFN
jgi:hypothetical protein